MREQFSRRQVLAGLAVGLAAPVPALAAAAPMHAWLHESGKPGEAGGFVLGGLFTAEPERLARALAEARRRTGFFGALRYSANNRFKAPYACAAVDALCEDPAARFLVRVVARWPADPAERRDAYLAAYAALLRDAGEGALALHRPTHRTIGPDEIVRRELASRAWMVPTDRGDVAQLAAFLTGSVAAGRRALRSPVKAALARHVVARLEANPRFSLSAA
jgi:hypothetical protein